MTDDADAYCPECSWLWALHRDGKCLAPPIPYIVEHNLSLPVEQMKQDNFPIDEVDAQTLFMVIRELHARKNFGVLRSAYLQIEDLLRGDIRKWQGLSGEDTSSQTGR